MNPVPVSRIDAAFASLSNSPNLNRGDAYCLRTTIRPVTAGGCPLRVWRMTLNHESQSPPASFAAAPWCAASLAGEALRGRFDKQHAARRLAVAQLRTAGFNILAVDMRGFNSDGQLGDGSTTDRYW